MLMKQKLLTGILFVTILLAAFYNALALWDGYVYYNLFNKDYDKSQYYATFEFNDLSSDTIEKVKEVFLNEGVEMTLFDFSSASDQESSDIYLLVLDDTYFKKLPIRNIPKDPSSFAKIDNYSQKDLITFDLGNISLRSFETVDDFTFYGYHNLLGINEEKMISLKSELAKIGVKIEFHEDIYYDDPGLSSSFEFSEYLFNYQNYPMYFLILVMIVIFALDHLNKADYIAKLKLEGYRFLTIYMKIKGWTIVLTSFSFLILGILISLFLVKDVLSFAPLLLLPFSGIYLLCFMAVMLIDLLFYSLTYHLPPLEVLKGKRYGQGSYYLLKGLKVLLVVLTFASLVNKTLDLKDFLLKEREFKIKSDTFKDVYSANLMPSYNLSENIDQNKLFNDIMNDERIVWRMSGGYNMIYDPISQTPDASYYIGYETYAKVNDLSCDEEPTLYFKKGSDLSSEESETVIKDIKNNYGDVKIAYYDHECIAYDLASNDYYNADLYVDVPILILPDTYDQMSNISAMSIYKAKDDLNHILKDAYGKQGLYQSLMAVSIYDELMLFRNMELKEAIMDLVFIAITLLGYALLSLELKKIEENLYHQKYYVKVIEGHRFIYDLKIKFIEIFIMMDLLFISVYSDYQITLNDEYLIIGLITAVIYALFELCLVYLNNYRFHLKVAKGEIYEDRN